MGEKKFIGGNECHIDIDPVVIDTSMVGQAKNELEELKSILAVAQKGEGFSRSKMQRAYEKVKKIEDIAKRAIKEYKVKQNDKRKEELTEILKVVKKSKAAIKMIERRFMLESDSPEVVEKRRLMTGWTREQEENGNHNEDR